jgi:hypothetical protein
MAHTDSVPSDDTTVRGRRVTFNTHQEVQFANQAIGDLVQFLRDHRWLGISLIASSSDRDGVQLGSEFVRSVGVCTYRHQ